MRAGKFYPVILAGGSGTRFWPRSRRRRAKQVLALEGRRTMIQRTFDRLLPLARLERFWIITNSDVAQAIRRQLPRLQADRLIAEPASRNTAPAIGLAAFIVHRKDPDAVLGMFPADHAIADEKRFQAKVRQAVKIATEDSHIVVLGITPTRAETGYGYIETGSEMQSGVFEVRRFTEKPSPERAEEFVGAGNYYWNSGMFFWRAATVVEALREHLSETAPYLEEIAAAFGTPRFSSVFRRLYPKCENISADYAILEPRSAKGEHSSNIFCLPANFGWSDLGSWAALYDYRISRNGLQTGQNIIEAGDSFTLGAEGNYFYAPGKFIAALGVKNLVVVDADDAMLITTRERSQDVGRVVKHLSETRQKRFL